MIFNPSPTPLPCCLLCPPKTMKMHQRKEGILVYSSVKSKSHSFRGWLSLTLTTLLFGFSLSAQRTTYYVANDGNDNADGLTPGTAWKTIKRVNDFEFQPGDQLLFKGGDEFNGTLFLDGQDGNDPMKPMDISSYGEGRATLNGGNSFGIVVTDTEGLYFSNLAIKGSGMQTNTRSGIYLLNTLESDFKFTTFSFTDLEISDFGEYGISIRGISGNSGFQDVLIDGVRIHDCLEAGIHSEGEFSNTKSGYAHNNIQVRNSEIFNIPGIDKGTHSGSGIVLANTRNSMVEHCVVYNCGDQNTQCGGPVGIWFWESDSVIIQHCEVYNISSGTGCDGGGFDMDGGVTNGIMQYNYSHDNAGPGFLVGQFIDSRRMYNITVRYNISENDGRTNGGGIYLFNLNPNYPPERIRIYHNTIFVSPSPDHADVSAVGALDNLEFGEDIAFINNIIYTRGNTLLTDIPKNKEVRFLNNLYYSEGNPKWKFNGNEYNSLEAFRNSGNETLQGQPVGLYADPMLNNPGLGGTLGLENPLDQLPAYQLAHRSPALNIALPIEENDSPVDFFGTTSLLGPEKDLGAYELDDKIPPEIFLLGDDPLVIEAGFDYEDPGAYTDDGSEVITITEGLKKQVGEYEVVYSSTDVYGNSSETTRLIKVIDTRAPEIACDEMFLELNEQGKAELTEAFVKANISDPSEFKVDYEYLTYSCESKGVNQVMIKATDIYGNTNSCLASVDVVDLLAPELLTPTEELPLQLYVAKLDKLEFPDISRLIQYRDNCTPKEEIEYTQHPKAGTLMRAGYYELVITLTDAAGNVNTLNYNFTITEGIPNGENLFIYPNPVKDRVRFNKEVVRTTIYDLKGSLLLQTYDPTLDLSSFQKGIYLFEVVTPEGTFYKKVIKN